MIQKKSQIISLSKNKKALFNYEIIKDYEVGIELLGYEVKSIRLGNINFKGSFISIQDSTANIMKFYISPYKFIANKEVINPTRERKLFLHKKDILYLIQKQKEKGNTIIPLEIYLKGNLIKLKIALVKGKKKYEKKEAIKNRDVQRDVEISLKEI